MRFYVYVYVYVLDLPNLPVEYSYVHRRGEGTILSNPNMRPFKSPENALEKLVPSCFGPNCSVWDQRQGLACTQKQRHQHFVVVLACKINQIGQQTRISTKIYFSEVTLDQQRSRQMRK